MPDNLRGVVRIKVSPTITLENLNSLVGRIAGLTGCRPCGILGVDLQIVGDPPEAQDLSKVPGVESVSFE